MDSQPPKDQQNEAPEQNEYNIDGEMLTEVMVSDDAPPDDDDESIWTDDGDNVEENEEEGEALGRSTRFTGPVDEMAVAVFEGHTDSVYCAAIHPFNKGTVITGGGDDCAYLWTYMDNGEIPSVFPLKGHTDTVVSVGFNYDGTLALTGSYDGTVRIWEVLTGKQKQVLEGPEDIEFASWHGKGNAIIAGSKDGTVWMWLSHNGQCVQVFAGHDGGVTCGAFSKDGNVVFTGGEDGTVRLWAPKNGKCKHVFEGSTGHQGMVTCIAGSDDGDLILSGSVDGRVLLLQISKKKILQAFIHSKPKALGTDGMPLPPPPKTGTITATATATASASAASNQSTGGDMDMEAEEGEFGEFDEIDEDEEEGEGTMSVECVGFSKGAFRWAASGGLDKTLKVWDIATGSCRSICPHGDSVVSLQWHDSLPIVTTAALDHIVRVWDARGGVLLLQLTGHRDLVTNIEMRSLTYTKTARKEGEKEAEKGENEGEQQLTQTGEIATDMLVSVSDDHTARVFYYCGSSLLM